MIRRVSFARGALNDLRSINSYLRSHAGSRIANATVDRIEQRCAMLAEMPQRGNVPPELLALGITEHREIHEPPYRICYRSGGLRIVIYLVADARREIRTLLDQRLLR